MSYELSVVCYELCVMSCRENGMEMTRQTVGLIKRKTETSRLKFKFGIWNLLIGI